MSKKSGFTVVEIVVIIAVLGILAGIVAVGWGGMLLSGRDRTRETEQQDWVKRFETYRQRFGVYPNATISDSNIAITGTHCLGTGFPVTTGFPDGRCRSTTGSPSTAQVSNSDIMQQLAKVGTLPDFQHTAARGGYVGPWVEYIAGTPGSIRIYQAYEKSSCPSGTTLDSATYSSGTVCYIQLTKN